MDKLHLRSFTPNEAAMISGVDRDLQHKWLGTTCCRPKTSGA
jgi:hypothetical protein